MLSDKEKSELLAIARDAVAAAVARRPAPPITVAAGPLTETCGAFVTLKSRGRLRGCIGQFTSDLPLYQTVQQMARASATEDPRFTHDRVGPGEVPALDIEISILSPLARITDPLSMELGKHGIYIKNGYRAGCFLPQVATETGWSKEEFLTQCCLGKAGLPADAWRNPATEVYLFTAEIIGE